MNDRRIRVLVVDDSAFARKVAREVLSSDPEIEVIGIAHDGLDALEKIAELRPDVVTLDLRMPALDGVGVLQALASRDAPRCVLVSTSDSDSELAVAALQAGAVDLVHKPTGLATEQLYELSTELVAKVKIAARARTPRSVDGARVPPPSTGARARPGRIVVVGASTGGPQAITHLLAGLPRDFPAPIAVVLHMPIGYTTALAERLNDACAIEVAEACEGMPFRAGLAVIARAGLNLTVAGTADSPHVHLSAIPLLLHRPAVDVLFTTAALVFGAGVVGVVLTGMGDDGLQGSRAVRAAGGHVLTEAESSCVVYGMPRAVSEAGLSDESVPLDGMMSAVQRQLDPAVVAR